MSESLVQRYSIEQIRGGEVVFYESVRKGCRNQSAGHVHDTTHDRSRRPRRHLQEAHQKSRLRHHGIETTAATPIGQESYQRFGRQPATGLGGLDNSSRRHLPAGRGTSWRLQQGWEVEASLMSQRAAGSRWHLSTEDALVTIVVQHQWSSAPGCAARAQTQKKAVR